MYSYGRFTTSREAEGKSAHVASYVFACAASAELLRRDPAGIIACQKRGGVSDIRRLADPVSQSVRPC